MHTQACELVCRAMALPSTARMVNALPRNLSFSSCTLLFPCCNMPFDCPVQHCMQSALPAHHCLVCNASHNTGV